MEISEAIDRYMDHQRLYSGKNVVEEIIFRIDTVRNRIMPELIARGGMRISEVLKLKGKEADDRKPGLIRPKVGKTARCCLFRRWWRTV